MAAKQSRLAKSWKKQIELWQASNSSISEWCRKHDLAYHQFFYWKDRFAKPDKGTFIEVQDEDSRTGISIECQGLNIRVARDFDSPTLQRLIRLLRRP